MTSSVDSHAIPSFYACYLMRSYATTSSSRTYIGSTPDPIRRKKQHNGILTQGAHKTKRGRPWETQLIVWGFPSKIAALQFEWAWQKSHLSRHLRSHGNQNEGSSSCQHIPLPLFTDTPVNQVATSTDGCKALPCNSVQSSLLVARALLRSEPFSTWSLRITFFEEYCWAAWCRLESELSHEFERRIAVDLYEKVGLKRQKSRLGRPLPPAQLSPSPICDFAGVDGNRKSLLSLNEQERIALKLEAKVSKSVQEGRSPGQWPEKLPRTLTVRAMGGTWDIIKKAPLAPAPVLPDGSAGGVKEGAALEKARMQLNDDDPAELSWQRYLEVLKKRNLSIEAIKVASGETPADQECGLCQSTISMRQHLTYTTCPSPFPQLRHRTMAGQTEVTLSQFGFHRSGSRRQEEERNFSFPSVTSNCHSLFHISCLAQHFTAQHRNGDIAYILPTHGVCPSCGIVGKEEQMNTWIEVIRGVHRRKERLEKEVAKAVAAKLREEKLQLKNATKKRSTAKSSSSKSQTMPETQKTAEVDELDSSLQQQKRPGLLGALDDIPIKAGSGKRSFRPVSTLLRDPIQPSSKSTAPNPSKSMTPTSQSSNSAKRSSLLCTLDGILNLPPSQTSFESRMEAKRAKSTSTKDSPMGEVIDLT